MRLILAIGVFAALAYPAEALPVARFPVTCHVVGRELEVHGVGRLSRWLITGCDVALYLPPGMDAGNALDDVAKRLHLHYYRNITAEQFMRGAMDTLEKAFPPEQLETVRSGIETLHAAYRDVGRGDAYTLTYVPGDGTSLALNGSELVKIPGGDFARVYFSVWLGEKPIDKRLRAGLFRRLDVSRVQPDATVEVGQ